MLDDIIELFNEYCFYDKILTPQLLRYLLSVLYIVQLYTHPKRWMYDLPVNSA